MAETAQRESRVKKTLLNARVNLIFYFLTLCLSFFSRKIFLDCLGADFVGLTGTLQNLLGFLNLAELGIGTAIGYLLYKPLFDHDQTKINEIISVMGYLYRWIGIIILGCGIVLSLFLPLIFPDSGFQLPLIYFTYYSFLASSLIGYFINYRQNLLGADQRNYVVTAYFQTASLIKTIIQMALAYYTGSYYLWVLIELTFGIIYSIILNWKINQTYPWLKADVKLGKKVFKKYPEVITKTKQLFIHRMIPFIHYQCSSFIIYTFTSLTTVALYGNYTIVLDKITQLINNAYNPLGAGVGNLIAEGNKNKIEQIYWELLSVRFVIAGAIAYSIIFLIQPFITLWLGEKYLLDQLVVILLSINIFVRLTREISDPFLFGAGLFQDILAPIVEITIFLIVSISCGHLWGLYGVILGGITSVFVIGWFWKPYFLYTRLFHTPLFYNILHLIKHVLILLIAFGLSAYLSSLYTFISPYKSLINLIIYAIPVMLTYLIITCLTMYLFSSGFHSFAHRIISKS